MINVISFGYGHGPAPEAEITVDLRRKFRNPHHDPSMRELTALSPEVYAHVMETEGIRPLVWSLVSMAMSMHFNVGDVTLAFGCAGGRHRAAAVAIAVAKELTLSGCPATLTHRDLHLPVLPSSKHV